MSKSAINHAIAQQAECAAYLAGDGPDKAGAWRGLCDWVMEECLLSQTADRERVECAPLKPFDEPLPGVTGEQKSLFGE